MQQSNEEKPHSTSQTGSPSGAVPTAPFWRRFLRRHGITVVLLAAVVYLWYRPPATVTKLDEPISNWSVQLTDGRVVTSDQLKGKIVLVNFWATWCPYCLKEMPVIEEFWNDHKAQGFEVVAISVDDPLDKVRDYMHEHEHRFMAGSTNAEIEAAFGRAGSIPTSFVLDRNGEILYKISGQVHYKRLTDTTGLK